MGEILIDEPDLVIDDPAGDCVDYWASLLQEDKINNTMMQAEPTMEVNLFEKSTGHKKLPREKKSDLRKKIKKILENATFPPEQVRKAIEGYAQDPSMMDMRIDQLDPNSIFLFDICSENFLPAFEFEKKGMLQPIEDAEFDWQVFQDCKELNLLSKHQDDFEPGEVEDQPPMRKSCRTERYESPERPKGNKEKQNPSSKYRDERHHTREESTKTRYQDRRQDERTKENDRDKDRDRERRISPEKKRLVKLKDQKDERERDDIKEKEKEKRKRKNEEEEDENENKRRKDRKSSREREKEKIKEKEKEREKLKEREKEKKRRSPSEEGKGRKSKYEKEKSRDQEREKSQERKIHKKSKDRSQERRREHFESRRETRTTTSNHEDGYRLTFRFGTNPQEQQRPGSERHERSSFIKATPNSKAMARPYENNRHDFNQRENNHKSRDERENGHHHNNGYQPRFNKMNNDNHRDSYNDKRNAIIDVDEKDAKDNNHRAQRNHRDDYRNKDSSKNYHESHSRKNNGVMVIDDEEADRDRNNLRSSSKYPYNEKSRQSDHSNYDGRRSYPNSNSQSSHPQETPSLFNLPNQFPSTNDMMPLFMQMMTQMDQMRQIMSFNQFPNSNGPRGQFMNGNRGFPNQYHMMEGSQRPHFNKYSNNYNNNNNSGYRGGLQRKPFYQNNDGGDRRRRDSKSPERRKRLDSSERKGSWAEKRKDKGDRSDRGKENSRNRYEEEAGEISRRRK